LATRANQKLAFKYFGPYKITDKIGSVAYRLKLSDGCAIHPVFHVSQLKKCVSQPSQVSSTLPDPVVALYQVSEKILKAWWLKKGGTDIAQVLVQWSNMSPELATWEDKEALQQRFPLAPIWGQPGAQARGGVAWLI
jgi:hypothetical protein